MNLEQYRVAFLVVTLGLVLIAVSPLLAILVNVPDASERFSEFGLLGPEHTVENYPFNVIDGEEHGVFTYVGNHMGSTEHYKIYVKFGNDTQIHFDKASSLPPLYEFRAFVDNEGVWESPATFTFQNIALTNNTATTNNITTTLPIEESMLSVGSITINGITFPVDASTGWDSEDNGFYFRLSFELHRYDDALKSFSFHDSVVGLRLNMTIPQ
ncbi:MAG: DUF1616 domain-containing protein [Candidatus Bathyarchaeota archaeon]